MKTIYKYIVLSTVTLACGLYAAAQNLPEGTYEGQNGIAYRKSSTLKSGTTDTYIVNLDTFVYGEVTVETKAVPADIVLVLDVSGSMNEHMFTAPYTARSSQNYSFNSVYSLDDDEAIFYRYTDGNYYRVFYDYVERYYSGSGYYYFRLYFEVDGTKYYLTRSGGSNTITTTAPTNVTGLNDRIWTGVLYNGTSSGTKIDKLKTAVGAFIDKIRHNDLYEDDTDDHRRVDEHGNPTSLGNQISIVKFAAATYYNSSTTASIAPGNHYVRVYDNNGTIGFVNYSTSLGNNQNANCTEVLASFTPTAELSDVNSLKADVNALQAAGQTASDLGMNLARLLLESIKDTRTESSKTVVFFTDGEPTHNGIGFSGSSGSYVADGTTVASNTIGYSRTIKNTYEAQVFTVGVFSNLGSNATNVANFMNYTSSNYPNALNMSQPGNPVAEGKRVYYQNASNADLTAIFTTIAQSSGGSGNTQVSGSSAVTVDVVASSFSLPANITANDITVTVAPCTGFDDENHANYKEDVGEGKERLYLTFGTAKAPEDYGLPNITPVVDPEHNMVTTSGFDFSANWCGNDPSDANTSTYKPWRGYKQTISFEIKLREEAVGGPNVVTNDEKSGIYVNGEPVATFNRPTVKIPVSLWIKKKGLLGEDSAVFNVQYAKYQAGVDPIDLPNSAWKSFTKVIVNSNSPKDSDDYPIVKLVGLDPDYFYRIKEDAWAWTYNYVDGGIQYAFGEDQQNPFVFDNTPKPNIKSAEATVQNVFNEPSSK